MLRHHGAFDDRYWALGFLSWIEWISCPWHIKKPRDSPLGGDPWRVAECRMRRDARHLGRCSSRGDERQQKTAGSHAPAVVSTEFVTRTRPAGAYAVWPWCISLSSHTPPFFTHCDLDWPQSSIYGVLGQGSVPPHQGFPIVGISALASRKSCEQPLWRRSHVRVLMDGARDRRIPRLFWDFGKALPPHNSSYRKWYICLIKRVTERREAI